MSVAVHASRNWQFGQGTPSALTQREFPEPETIESSSTEIGTAEEKEQKTTTAPPEKVTDRARQKTVRQDKAAFVFGVLHFWVYAYWLGSYPSTFYKLYSVEAFVLFPLRWKSFKRMKMHYYMFDFCYWANFMLLVSLWVFPKSPFLFKILFAYNSGPLAWSIMLFKNSMVYHSLSEVTSLFMHWCPMLVSWTLRWYPDCSSAESCEQFANGRFDATFLHFLLWPMIPYLAWAVFYYLKLFVVSSNKIRDRGYQTLYKYMLEEANFGLLKRIVFRFSPRWRPLVYMAVHLTLVFFSLSACILWWNSFWAHSAFVVIATVSSAWHGAAHYFQ